MTRWMEVLRFELGLHLRRPSTWLFFALLVGLAVLFMVALGSDMGTNVNAPASVALYTFVLGFFGLLVTAALFGDAASRDAETRMQALFFATPLRKSEYLAGRYLGALIVNGLVLLAVPLGFALATMMPVHDPSLVGPFTLASYVRPYVLFLLPGLLVSSTILFGVAATTRRTLPTYLAAVGLFAAYAGAVLVTGELMDRRIGAVLDPSGIVVVLELVRDWSPVERNTLQVPFRGQVLLNRLIWLAVGLGVAALVYRRYRFAHHEVVERRATRERVMDDSGVAHVVPVRPPSTHQAFDAPARGRQVLAVMRRSLLHVLEGREFRIVLVALFLFAVAFGWEVLGDDWGTPSWPVTSGVAQFLASGIFTILIALLTAFYAGELVWAERDAGMADITDTAPTTDWAPFLGKALALGALLVIVHATLILAGITLQALQGYHRFEPGLYLQVVLGLALVDSLLFAVAALLVHALVNHKYVGHLAAVFFFLATRFAGSFGVHHNLIVFGADGGWVHSDISGFGPFLPAYLWTKLYWMAWALLFVVVGGLVWVRGRETGLRHRTRLMAIRLTRRAAAATAAATALILATGGFVYYNTNVLNAYRTPEERAMVQVEYERRYGRLDDAPQPTIVRVQVRVEHYPDRRSIEVQGSYVLVNRTARAIDSVLIFLRPFYELRAARLDRPAREVLADPTHRLWIHDLDRPLPPGDSLQLQFELVHEPRGFPDGGFNTSVVENGTYLERHEMPAIGYQRSFELDDPVVRRRFGLPAREQLPPPTDLAARMEGPPLIEYDAVIGTSADQVAVAPGMFRRSWTENGRRYFQYASAGEPMINSGGFLSGRYAIRDTSAAGMRVQLMYHPGHPWNVDRFLGAAARSLAYFTANFGRSPYREVRIVEFPRYARKATAAPYLIAHSESFGFLARVDDAEGDLDTPLIVTAHELGHFWWGGQVMPAPVLGGQVLTETLATYSAMMVLEDAHGPPAARRFQRIMHVEYLNRRGRGDLPLLTTGDNPNVHYRKGAVAMYALKEYIGEARLNAALRSLVAKFGLRGAPYPTSLDLYAELQAVTPDSLQYLLTDLFETMTFWDLRAGAVRAEPLGDDRYRVMLTVEAAKFRVDSLGRETRVPVEDLLEVGVFGAEGDAPLYRGRHWIRADTATITVTVRGKPHRAGIDPYALLVARRGDDLADNVREVQ